MKVSDGNCSEMKRTNAYSFTHVSWDVFKKILMSESEGSLCCDCVLP